MRLVLACCLFSLVLTVPASAGAPVIPIEWQGIWEVTTTTRVPCEIGPPMQSTSTDTLCAGDTIDPGEAGVECTGSSNSTSFEVSCTGSFTEEGCTVTIVTSFQGTRTGDSFTESGTVVTTAEDPKACGFTEFCTESTSMGKRISTDPGACESTPTESVSWSEIKTEYR